MPLRPSISFLGLSFALVLMATVSAPGASASAVPAPELWNSLQAFLHRYVELHASFQASISASPFFTGSLAELASHLPDVQSANPAALSSIALVLDSLLAKPFNRVTRGPACSPFTRRSRLGLAAPISRGWVRVARAVQRWDAFPLVNPSEMGRAASKIEKIETRS